MGAVKSPVPDDENEGATVANEADEGATEAAMDPPLPSKSAGRPSNLKSKLKKSTPTPQTSARVAPPDKKRKKIAPKEVPATGDFSG